MSIVLLLFGVYSQSNAQSKVSVTNSAEKENTQTPASRQVKTSKMSTEKATVSAETQLPRATVSANRKADITNYQLTLTNWVQNADNKTKLTKTESEYFTNGYFDKLYDNAVNTGNIIYATETPNPINND